MSEYIKREDVINKFKGMVPSVTRSYIVEAINAIPAEDVEPVVLGEWKWVESGVWICTRCKTRRYTNTSRYCPECGAHVERSGNGDK